MVFWNRLFLLVAAFSLYQWFMPNLLENDAQNWNNSTKDNSLKYNYI